MEIKELLSQKLKDKFPDTEFEFSEFRGELTIRFPKEIVLELCKFLKEDPDLEFSEVVIRTNIPNLSLLGAGTYSPHATELLSSARMGEFITDIANRYPDRVIIFDAPPVLASSEPSVLAMYMGQIVMVVEADKTGRRALEEALSLISTCQSISFVLNKISFKAESDRFGAYYYGYSER